MAWMSGAQRQAQRDVAEVAMATLGAFVVDKPPKIPPVDLRSTFAEYLP
jgi:hypothetical protein